MNTKYAIIGTLAIVGLFTGCGAAPKDFGPFSDYVAAYEREGMARGKDVNLDNLFMSFEEGPATPSDLGFTVGHCDHTKQGRIIKINHGFWNNWSPEIRELVLFHELGHCVSQKLHYDDTPAIMNAAIRITRADWAINRSAYLNQHFN